MPRKAKQGPVKDNPEQPESLHRIVADTTFNWEFWIDPSGRFVYCSPSCKRLTGHAAEEFLADPALRANVIHPEDRNTFDRHVSEVEEQQKAGEGEWRCLLPDGTYRWVAHACQPIYDHEGCYLGVRGSNRDVTGRKESESRSTPGITILARMHDLSARRLDGSGIQPLLQDVMDTAVGIAGADLGTLQLLVGDSLRIVAHHGHEEPFLEYFAAAENRVSACGMSLSTAERVVVEDVVSSPVFSGTESLPFLLAAGVRAVVSTPLVTRAGRLTGILTTQWRAPHSPSHNELELLDLVSRQAADIIDQSAAEEKLRESEQKYRELVENVGSIILRFDTEARITFFNEFAEQFFGYTSDEILGRPAVGTIIPESDSDGRDLGTMVRDLLKHPESFQVNENENMKKSGERVWVRWTNKPVFNPDGTLGGFLAVGIDSTERHRAEEKIKELTNRYELVIAGAHAAIWDWDVPNRRVAFSPQWKAMRGYADDEISDREEEWSEGIHPDDAQRVFAAVQAHFAGETPVFREEYRVRCKDGSYKWILDSGMASRDASGTVVRMAGSEEDITDRKLAEEALRESERRFLLLFEKAPYAVGVTRSADGVFVDVNEKFTSLLGYTKQEVVGKTSMELGINRTPEFYPRILRHLKRDQTLNDTELEVFTKSGERLVILINIGIIDFHGQEYFLTTALDVTERKRAEEELRESRTKYQALIESTADFIWEMDRYARYTYCSPQMKALWDIDPEDMIGKTPFHLMPPDDQERVQQFFTSAVLRPFRDMRTTAIVPGGKMVFIETSGVPFFDDNGTFRGYRGISRDVTARKSAERELQSKNQELSIVNEELFTAQEETRSNCDRLLKAGFELQETSQYLENLINYANAPIIVWDPDFRITRFNRAFEDLTGKRSQRVIGRRLDILFPPVTRADSMELIRRAMTGERWETVEIPVRGRDGTNRLVLWNSAPIFGSDSRTIVSVIAQGQDITEMKKAETALRESVEKLKRSNMELEQFAYVASHDLREPLRMVTSFSQLLQQKYEGRLDADADEYIHYIVDGGRTMNALVNDLLEFSRVTSKAKPFEPADMNEVVEAALQNLSVSIGETSAEIAVDDLPVINVDRSQMIQVFQNLISNAIKFRGWEPPGIRISALRRKAEWVFSVTDNGIGIDPGYWDKIFEIFKRLHTREEYPGTGIGLAICRRIIERHGGKIWVDSEEFRGSTFYFTIPAELQEGVAAGKN